MRRLRALIEGLPGDAATWREDMLPPVEERLAQLTERQDQWFRALFGALTHSDQIRVPAEIEIVRPGAHKIPDSHVVTDSRAIAAWFARFGG
jgi:hypothetical protein